MRTSCSRRFSPIYLIPVLGARLALISWIVALGSLAACRPGGHIEAPAQPPVSCEPGLATVLLAGEPPAGYRDRDDGNRLGDTPARADDHSRLAARLASETTGTPHINDVARRVRYNGAYFEIDVEVNRERGIVPVTWDMLRAHTPLVSQAYYARVYRSRGWSNGRQAPGFGPDVILPEAFTPVLFEYVKRAFVSWNRDFDDWTQEMANAWMKEAAIHVARVWTPEYVGGVAVASVRASQITGKMALGAAAVPNAAAATRACSGGRCLPAVSRGGWVLPEGGGGARIGGRWFTEHALERMAPRTPEVMALLERRALARAKAAGLKTGTPEFKAWWAKYGPDPRGIPPAVVEAEIANPGSTGVRVITNQAGDVVTVIPRR